MSNIPEIFGSLVFNEVVMKDRLPKDTFKALMKTRNEGIPLDAQVAEVVANAMKSWAIEKGATHYTHWFQPMTGITAGKHDGFINPAGDGKVIMEFSGKELIQGEPDASSFPNGGIRATFEARGYTAWDPTSYAFVKDGSLFIPTVFCSYGGEALDKKAPLLRSISALNKETIRVLKLFGYNDVKSTTITVGPEQEYFLVPEEKFLKREDLVYTGRTLFGAKPPKGQELDDHYFGELKVTVSEFMKEMDEELWKLGVLSKTKHNEVAPAQHEMAPIFSACSLATDQNQLTMEVMKKVAARHGLTCLLHEKPFARINGSGKHNNYSIATDTGMNLLDPGDSPTENAQFLLFLTAIIKAVDEHQDLLRIAVADAGNDHRLGGNEAPPAIVSIFIGEELENVLNAIENGTEYKAKGRRFVKIGADILPPIRKDSTDRNRTSPMAFTGNKFEFRMQGSSSSIGCINIMLNTMIADVLSTFADELEKAENFTDALNELIRKTLKAHKRIVFNGNNYSAEWVEEAGRRGLLNLRSTPEALAYYTRKENVELFERQGVLTETELKSRYEIILEKYIKQVHIEALTMLEMIRKDILPAVSHYTGDLSAQAINKKNLGIDCSLEKTQIEKLTALSIKLYDMVDSLQGAVDHEEESGDYLKEATYYREEVLSRMEEARAIADEMELLVGRTYWPFPTYGELLFGVK